MIGFLDKKDLKKWKGKDLIKAKNCRWMIDRQVKSYPHSFIKQFKECLWWNRKLLECLPSQERYDYIKSIKKISIILQPKLFENNVRLARYSMVMALIAHDYQKSVMLEETRKRKEEELAKHNLSVNPQNSNLSITEEFRIQQLSQMYPEGSPNDIKQREEKVIGYIPIKEVLDRIPPMEIIEYCGFKLIKYDQWHGYYAIVLVNNLNEYTIFYDENAYNVETLAEQEFDKAINNYLNKQNNAYGNKSYEEVDISNVTENMSHDNPETEILNQTDIF